MTVVPVSSSWDIDTTNGRVMRHGHHRRNQLTAQRILVMRALAHGLQNRTEIGLVAGLTPDQVSQMLCQMQLAPEWRRRVP